MNAENENPQQKTIKVLVVGKQMILIIAKILYCLADGDYTLIFRFNKLYPLNQQPPLRASGHLLEIETLIASDKFIRIGRKSLANKDYYINIFTRQRKGTLLLENETRIPVPRAIFDEIYRIFKGK